MIELSEYVTRRVSVICCQLAAKLVMLPITIAIGINNKSPIRSEGAVQRFNLNENSLRKSSENDLSFKENSSKSVLIYSQPALSNNFTASLLRIPRIDKFILSDLNFPQLFKSSDLLFSILIEYS